ncbi:MAG: 4Fe-4S dicluster domain-containing protein [Bacteroidales bacterium]
MKKNQNAKSRRDFLKMGLMVGGGIAGGSMISSCGSQEQAHFNCRKVKVLTPDGKLVEVHESAMMEVDNPESQKEVRNGIAGKKFAMVIDLARCKNARKCVESCQKMHNLAPKDEWLKVYLLKDSKEEAYYWFPKPCFHCDSPPCVNVCPVGATFKREDGIVLIDNNECIGCKFCMAACPYSSRVFNWGEPNLDEESAACFNPEAGVQHQVGTVGKCDFCPDMAKKGELPSCVTACPNGTIFYGDINEDMVTNGVETFRFRELLETRAGYRYMEELGTRPSVYYLPPVNRQFPVERGFEGLDEEVSERYKNERIEIIK